MHDLTRKLGREGEGAERNTTDTSERLPKLVVDTFQNDTFIRSLHQPSAHQMIRAVCTCTETRGKEELAITLCSVQLKIKSTVERKKKSHLKQSYACKSINQLYSRCLGLCGFRSLVVLFGLLARFFPWGFM